MALLVAGILLFTVVHLLPAVAPDMRAGLAAKLGENAYRALFSAVILLSLVVIVFGWKAATPTGIYTPPLRGGPLVSAAIFFAFVLFVASKARSNYRRFVRHPQMMSVILWSAAHLLVNGDSRSVVLFGGLGAWAVAEIVLCNKRDGAWQKPDVAPFSADMTVAAIAAVAFAIFFYLHKALFGVIPYWPG
jgi:uncharacterized membrane protein